MADNLPLMLTYEMSTALRSRMFDLVDKFAREFDLPRKTVEQELGFIAAHYAAHVGVLDGKYKEWLNARRIPQATHSNGAGSHVNGVGHQQNGHSSHGATVESGGQAGHPKRSKKPSRG